MNKLYSLYILCFIPFIGCVVNNEEESISNSEFTLKAHHKYKHHKKICPSKETIIEGSCMWAMAHACSEYVNYPNAKTECVGPLGVHWQTESCNVIGSSGGCILINGCSREIRWTYPLMLPPGSIITDDMVAGAKDQCDSLGGIFISL